jgi:hypothetical protein
MDGAGEQLALLESPAVLTAGEEKRYRGRKKRGGYVPKYEVTDAVRQTNALLDQLLAQREGLKQYEGRCVGCGKVISTKAPHCNRRWCSAVWKTWARDQRRVVYEALKAASSIIILTDVTLPGAGPSGAGRVLGRRNYLPWAEEASRVVEPRALYRANTRFKKRMRWVKRQAYNDGRAALQASGFSTERLPPVLVCVLELQKRGALHAHLALGYTSEAERVFARAYIDSLKKWAPRCGLGFVQGWKQAEKSAVLGNERAASYLCKYLTKDHPPWFLRQLRGPVVTVSRSVIAQSMCTMGLLRKTRRLWAARDGRCSFPEWDWETTVKVGRLLDSRAFAAQGHSP